MKSKSSGKESEVDKSEKGLIIVGIGASAGGLEAFRTFFSAMPPDSGMAFVLVQHLSPNYESKLDELLGKTTRMNVVEATHGMPVLANEVYIIPPNATMTINKGHLVVARPAPPIAQRHPIDTFLVSLAQEKGQNAIGIILSGTGSDGSLGVTAIKEQGGITFAQAQFDHSAMSGMPNSAMATGQVDHVLLVEDIPAKLVEYQQYMRRVQSEKDGNGTRKDTAKYLPEIFDLLRTGIGHDFSHYKEKTLIRRIQRRMQILQIDTVPRFIEILKQEPKELELLFHDLLIGVTEFFRDPDAFQMLEENIIPKRLGNKHANSEMRIWIVGCATGQEAYSIAILLAEALQKLKAAPKVSIFATDIDDQAVSFARNGRYLKSHLDGVSPERLKRWFVKEGEHYCVSNQIREMCIFSVHSVVKDPPFSKLDLISCRNLLIYLNAALQDRLIPTFHYALQPGGFLFLGSSEGIAQRNDLFTPIDEKYRLFQRQDEITPTLPTFPLLPTGGKNTKTGAFKNGLKESGIERGARRVMERYSPAHVVIDRQHQVISFSGQTGKYLDPSPGAASLDLFQLLQKPLRSAARSLLQEAITTQQRVFRENIPLEVNGISDVVTLIIEPILQASGNTTHYIVVFQKVESLKVTESYRMTGENCPSGIEKLENELRATRARLQAALDEAEEANEDLKSSNEELQSLNEELHSFNVTCS